MWSFIELAAVGRLSCDLVEHEKSSWPFFSVFSNLPSPSAITLESRVMWGAAKLLLLLNKHVEGGC